MSNADMFYHLVELSKKGGYKWQENKEGIHLINGHILYERHIPIIFRPSFLKAIFGKSFSQLAHEALEVRMKGGNPLSYLYNKSLELKKKS